MICACPTCPSIVVTLTTICTFSSLRWQFSRVTCARTGGNASNSKRPRLGDNCLTSTSSTQGDRNHAKINASEVDRMEPLQNEPSLRANLLVRTKESDNFQRGKQSSMDAFTRLFGSYSLFWRVLLQAQNRYLVSNLLSPTWRLE